jgi:hypothetical protein
MTLVDDAEDNEEDYSMNGLVRLTQSFQQRGGATSTFSVGGRDDVDFDADADGVFGGDADE